MSLIKPSRILSLSAAAAVLALTVVSCGDDDGNNDNEGGGATGGGGNGTGATGTGSTGTGATGTGASGSGTGGSAATGGGGTTGGTTSTGGTRPDVEPCPGLPVVDSGSAGASGETCIGTASEVEGSPVDMFILMDRTISMSYVTDAGITRWEALTLAVEAFSEAPEAANVNAGIVFYNAHGTGQADTECNVNDYATPVVDMAPLAENATDIIGAMDAISPAGLTPLVPALEGAMQFTKSWASAHPDRVTVLVVVGDGFPTMCDDRDPSDVAAVVQDGYQTQPSIRTYAIGVGASSSLNLDNFARSGGTNEAVMVEDDNVTTQFLEAMLNITNSNIPCDYDIPDPPAGQGVDYNLVSVLYDPFVGEPEEIPKAEGPTQCANGGWYYDNPLVPTRIIMCPCSCTRLGAGLIEARFGCRPQPSIG